MPEGRGFTEIFAKKHTTGPHLSDEDLDPFRAEQTIKALSCELDQTYRTVAANLPSNPGARVEQVDGEEDDLVVTPLDKLDEVDTLVKLREAVNAEIAAGAWRKQLRLPSS